jgi:hypothetical protein
MNLRNLSCNLSFCLVLEAALVPVFAADSPNNLWRFSKHVESGGAITMTVEMLDINNPPPNYHLSPPNDLDEDPLAPARLMFKSGTNSPIGTKFTVGYYRGPIYSFHGAAMLLSNTGPNDANYVSVFTTGDRSKLIAAVDHGLIYTSTNSGMAWTIIATPGLHEFPISTTADGGGIYAHATIEQPPHQVASDLTNRVNTDWYAVASSADGSKLVVGSSSSQPEPVLNIWSAENRVIIAWPVQFTSFVLQHNSSIGSGLWTDVTNPVQVVGGENQVVVPPLISNDFFRLRGH